MYLKLTFLLILVLDLLEYRTQDESDNSVARLTLQYTELCSAIEVILVTVDKNIRGSSSTDKQVSFGDDLLYITMGFLNRVSSGLVHSLQDLEEKPQSGDVSLMEKGTEMLEKVSVHIKGFQSTTAVIFFYVNYKS